MAQTYTGTLTGIPSIQVSSKAPLDVRTVVDNFEDLITKWDGVDGHPGIQNLYTGIVVYVKSVQEVYVLTSVPKKSNEVESWKKLGETIINPADNLEYYQEKLGARVVDSFDELTSSSIEDAFAGMLAVVKVGGESESEDESGLYVLTRTPNTTASNWYRILGGSGSGNAQSGLDVTEVITSDGSAPASGTGFSLSVNDPDALVEETYVDNGFDGGKYYTGRGLNSYDTNGGNELEDVDYITLTNGGDSYIQLNSADNDNWIELYIVDDSLGFTMQDVTWIDENGIEHQMTENPLILPKETPVSFGENPVDFSGMTETRGDDPTEYIFNDTGSGYEDIDIYTTNVLPTVYAYADGESVRVLTEGDKDELINRIDEATNFEPITNQEILGIF